MKRFLGLTVTAVALAALTGVAAAQWGHGPGRGMGRGMGGGRGSGPEGVGAHCAPAQTSATEITEDKAKELAQQYADKYLSGFTVERVLPFTAGHGTAYSVELKNQAGEARTIHVNPFGNVMPFGPRWRRS